ncbi:hypothetical protein GCM10010885_05710 [Alicyclobacillus cellulosilyticus]|uniref:Uncharacterized protein n=1 Tax=Alicyclobacillus cellulosilyticus TaxID=1003997 RepID=A0A917K3X6_9BACL|nr:hypothetical protein GCM10010885_05710 [Alicyclobacillus cellulosilyticus]
MPAGSHSPQRTSTCIVTVAVIRVTSACIAAPMAGTDFKYTICGRLPGRFRCACHGGALRRDCVGVAGIASKRACARIAIR